MGRSLDQPSQPSGLISQRRRSLLITRPSLCRFGIPQGKRSSNHLGMHFTEEPTAAAWSTISQTQRALKTSTNGRPDSLKMQALMMWRASLSFSSETRLTRSKTERQTPIPHRTGAEGTMICYILRPQPRREWAWSRHSMTLQRRQCRGKLQLASWCLTRSEVQAVQSSLLIMTKEKEKEQRPSQSAAELWFEIITLNWLV